MSRLPLGALALAALTVGCAEPRTEILLVVGSDLDVPAQIDTLRIRATGDTDGGLDKTYALTEPRNALPLTLGLVSGGGKARPLRVELTASHGNTPVVTRAASTSFVEGQVRVLHLDLLASCRGVTCDWGQTCVVGACGSDEVPASTLPAYGADAGAERVTDAAAEHVQEAGLEAGIDVSHDVSPDIVNGFDAADTAANDAPSDTPPPKDGGAGTSGSVPVLTYSNVTPTTVQGYTGSEATGFADACPDGQVVVGFNTTSNAPNTPSVVDQLQTICGVAKVSPDGSVVITTGTTLFLRGQIAGTPTAALCPANQVVIGFDGHAFDLLDQLSIRCAPLQVAGHTVTLGDATNLSFVGGVGGQPFARTDCAAGAVAVGTNVDTRTYISAFGLTCATVGAQ
jgi:hypothetical protein